jgi:hypothetical protein
MNRLTNISKEEILAYIEENKIEVFLSHEDEWEGETFEFWGCNTSTGFSTFEGPLTEDKAKYAAVLFHKLANDYDVFFPDAEALAYSYVTTFNVMQPPPSEEELEEARQAMLDAIKEGRVEIAGIPVHDGQDTFDFMKDEE